MENRYTAEQLNSLSKEQLIGLVIGMQKQLDGMNQKLEDLIEQIRIANSYRFGRKTEKLSQIDGQLSLFKNGDSAKRTSGICLMSLSFTGFPMIRSMTFTGKDAGSGSPLTHTSGYGSSRPDGSSRTMKSSGQSVPEVTIRMNLSVRNIPGACSATVSRRNPWLLRLITRNTLTPFRSTGSCRSLNGTGCFFPNRPWRTGPCMPRSGSLLRCGTG